MADILDSETSPKDRASLARAFKELAAQLRIEKGLANPAPIRTEPKRKARSAPAQPAEPVALVQPTPTPDKAA